MAFRIVRNDITKMQVDAIVNTANPLPGIGSGTDSAVYEAAGADELLKIRQGIGEVEGGRSFITDGLNLPARYIIHTVGVNWEGGYFGEEDVLRSCYKSVFALAVEHDIESLAIPLLASGCYGFPKRVALDIAVSEIEAFLGEHDIEIYLVVFDNETFSLSSERYGDIDEYISENYVEDKEYREYTLFEEEACAAPVNASFDASLSASLAGSSRKIIEDRLEKRAEKKAEKKERRLFGKGKTAAREAAMPAVSEDAEECAEESINNSFPGTAPLSAPGFMGDAMAPMDHAAMAMSAPLQMKQRSLDEVIGNLGKSFMELVFSFADEKGLSDVEVQKRANLDRKAFSKLKCGTTKNPSKSTALALAIALELSLDETKDLLSRAGLALSPCIKQDVIVRYFIEREAYDIYEINFALFEHGEPLLGSQAA